MVKFQKPIIRDRGAVFLLKNINLALWMRRFISIMQRQAH